ncbi:MAG: class I SAM-dependent methyltransferase [Acidimicrobiales bacterium]
MSSPDELLAEAASIPLAGWDFSVLGDRFRLEPPPWSFPAIVEELFDATGRLLDMGTGGGEWLASLNGRSAEVVATESWPPNVPIAVARLRPLGISVVQNEAATDNVLQSVTEPKGRLPFRAAAFDLVTNRHESFFAGEVRRVLTRGGIFVTQQANSGSARFHDLLGLEAPTSEEFSLPLAIDQLTRAGFEIEEAEEGIATTTFEDIGALAWYLTNVPWAVPDFSVARYRDALLGLAGEPIAVPSARFWLRARTR